MRGPTCFIRLSLLCLVGVVLGGCSISLTSSGSESSDSVAAQELLGHSDPIVQTLAAPDQVLDVQRRLPIQTKFATPTLSIDMPGLQIGTAEYPDGPTGVTVFHFPDKAFAAVDVRGGSPGTHLTAALNNGYNHKAKPFVDAVVLSGGSGYGLESISGVMAGLHANRGYSGEWFDIGIVPGAIIYDFGRRENGIHPDKRLGLAAFRAASNSNFYLGARGAGRSAGTGWFFGKPYMEPSGQGAAFRQVGPTKIAVFTVVNSNGAIVDKQGQVRRGNRDPQTGERTLVEEDLRLGRRQQAWRDDGASGGLTRATTITLVVTNQALAYADLRRLGIFVHTSMAKAIRPFHAPSDGDTLFATSTAKIDNPKLDFDDLATHAADVAWDAVLASIPGD